MSFKTFSHLTPNSNWKLFLSANLYHSASNSDLCGDTRIYNDLNCAVTMVITAKGGQEQVFSQLSFGRSRPNTCATHNAFKGEVWFHSIRDQSTHQNAGVLFPIWSCNGTESCPKCWEWSPIRRFARPRGSSPSGHGPQTDSASESTLQPGSRCSRRLGLRRPWWLTPSWQEGLRFSLRSASWQGLPSNSAWARRN